MIYLFEDRDGRMRSYLKENLDSSLIEVAIIDCQKNELEDYLSTRFKNSEAIIFHSSYSFSDNKITNEDVKKYFISQEIPFVYFSGGLSNNLVVENAIINGNVNSGDMYKNISSFLEDYKINKKVNIPILVYGKQYLLNSLLELQYVIVLFLFNKANDYEITTNDLYEITDLIDARLKESELEEAKRSLREYLTADHSKPIYKQNLLLQIQKLIDKY
ncbi:hypothetical protein [Chryseobacterium sp. S90]|uniref:hypothetical protein n=1 Tax=Chryseobacterium sp. S90 TaxID=3395373 RepID=UPI0039BC9605